MHSIHGIHAVLALISEHPDQIDLLLVSKDRQDAKLTKCLELAKKKGVRFRFAGRDELDAQSEHHQGVIALVEEQTERNKPALSLQDLIERSLTTHRLILALDGVTDPHNLGACIRSAEALGADGVIIPKDRSAQVNATVHKTSSGASQILPVLAETNLAQSLAQLKEAGFWLTGLEGEAETSICDIDFTYPTVIVLGSEGSGLRRMTKEHCDYLAKIPMLGQTESLNVSVACGITLFEVMRQRV